VRYLGIEVDDALEISEQIEIWTRRGCPPSAFCRRAAAYGDDAEGVLSAIKSHSSVKPIGPVKAVLSRSREEARTVAATNTGHWPEAASTASFTVDTGRSTTVAPVTWHKRSLLPVAEAPSPGAESPKD